jgi:hypothetical protein
MTKRTLADEQAIVALRRFADDIESGMLSATKVVVGDDLRYEIRVLCCLGERAEKLLAVAEGEGPPSPAPPAADTPPSSEGAVRRYRPPQIGSDECPKCKAKNLTEAGDLAWLCLSCQHEWAPYGAKRGG